MPVDAQVAPAVAQLAEEITVMRDGGGVRAEWGGRTTSGASPNVAAELGAWLYTIAHSRARAGGHVMPRTLQDPEIEERFREALGMRTVRQPVELIEERDGMVVIALDQVRIAAPRSAVDRDGEGTHLHVDWARPALSPGFYLLTSVANPMPARPGALIRLYAHLASPGPAPGLLARVADHLESLRVAWQAKAASNRHLYPRTDALVVYLPRSSWKAARGLAVELARSDALAEGTSVFAHPLSPSVGAAFEPADPRPGRDGLSFGEHRAQILAEAVIHHAMREDEQTLVGHVVTAFNNASIDPLNPARNLSSPVNPVIPSH